MKRAWIALLALLVLSVLSACGTLRESYELETGERVEGDQHLAVADVHLAAGSVLDGNLNITATDDVEINGRINGDLTVIASDLSIGATATISGNVVHCLIGNGELYIDDAAQIRGNIEGNCEAGEATVIDFGDSAAGRFAWVVFMTLAMSFVGAAGTVVFPRQMRRISLVAQENANTSIGLGLLTLAMAFGVTWLYLFSLVLLVPLILAPFAVAFWSILGITALLGTISIAEPIGTWILRRLRVKQQVPIFSATIGAGAVTVGVLIFSIISSLTFISIILGLLVISWGLGAALLTRLGTHFYRAVAR